MLVSKTSVLKHAVLKQDLACIWAEGIVLHMLFVLVCFSL
jgi:hypothetical protein